MKLIGNGGRLPRTRLYIVILYNLIALFHIVPFLFLLNTQYTFFPKYKAFITVQLALFNSLRRKYFFISSEHETLFDTMNTAFVSSPIAPIDQSANSIQRVLWGCSVSYSSSTLSYLDYCKIINLADYVFRCFNDCGFRYNLTVICFADNVRQTLIHYTFKT